ncbi:hypothetical protein ACFE04_014971 [Oxalis oulophora]
MVTPKSTIEPCSNSDSCNSMLGYTLYTDLKLSELSSLFNVDPISILTVNSIDISYPDIEHHILPAHLFLKIPILCSCIDGIRKSLTTHYKTRASDTLWSIADTVYGGLVSADQIREANLIPDDSSVLYFGQKLVVPLPCTCFNGTDNGLPAIHLSYVVKGVDTLQSIASRYATTLTDLMNVNAMGSSAVNDGDIIAIPLPACASSFPRNASDYGLLVANASYAITASHCVQCSCGPGGLNLYCMPSSLAASCSSMQCKNSNLMLGNVTLQKTSGGCKVTRCNYNGYVNDTITTTLTTSLQPRCPGPQKFPRLITPPTSVISYAPSPSLSDFSPANGPSGSVPGGISCAYSLIDRSTSSPLGFLLPFFVTLALS